VTISQALPALDRLCTQLDGRKRMRDGARTTVGALADAEPLRPLPVPFPAAFAVERTVGNQALVPLRGNRYSIPPGHSGQQVVVRHSSARPPGTSWTATALCWATTCASPTGPG
jgi:hypothetical protein